MLLNADAWAEWNEEKTEDKDSVWVGKFKITRIYIAVKLLTTMLLDMKFAGPWGLDTIEMLDS